MILFSTVIDYSVGRKLLVEKRDNRRKMLLWTSVIVNLGFLGFFKYYNFFLDNFVDAFAFFGTKISVSSLNIILPVGISFYTFQTLSYTIDVYKRKLEPTKDFIAFSAFVCFFPQLVAGPIERATQLLPQFYKKRVFELDKAKDGMRQILWGLFKKVVIADNCATFANDIFNNSGHMNGSALVLGALFFTFQIYGDFSGYSDIAIGTSRLFGFHLMQNFAFPYFSRDIAEFWRRWHISLSTWFRDYVYIPLGGSRGGIRMKIRNTFIIFVISGFWHGANWTFMVWGVLHALYFLPLLLMGKNRTHLGVVAEGNIWPSIKDFFSIIVTFSLTLFAWIFFRAKDLDHAFSYIAGVFSKSLFERPNFLHLRMAFVSVVLIVLAVVVEWLGRENKYALESLERRFNRPYRWFIYAVIVFVIGVYMKTEESPFIYFQF